VSAIPDNADAELEERILTASVKCALARTPAEHAPAWKELVALIGQRSPGQIHRMERERGLS
jgi:hypothetical protein